MRQFRVQKGESYEGQVPLRFPLIAQPKIDGIRAVIKDGKVLSASLKPIRCEFVQSELAGLPDGLDGELVVGPPHAPDVFKRTTTNGVNTKDAKPDFTFWVFDQWDLGGTPAGARVPLNGEFGCERRVGVVASTHIDSQRKLNLYVEGALRLGYEGVMTRACDAPYKFGRATLKQQNLLKIKPFVDSEATVVGAVELMRNHNEATIDERGLTKRSHAKAGKVPADTLGALQCRTSEGVEFEIGAGFTPADRAMLWTAFRRGELLGALVTYKHQKHTGGYAKPRLPVFKAIRHPDDTTNY